MRTFDLQAFHLRWRIRNAVGGERKYGISGSFGFVMSWHGAEPDLVSFRNAIIACDACHPWRDDVHPDSGSPDGIFFLGEGEAVLQSWAHPEKICWFTAAPRHDSVRRGQVLAYEKYLAKIAEGSAKLGLRGVSEVRSVIHIHSTTEFKAA